MRPASILPNKQPRIGIITLYRGPNTGSIAQALSLKHLMTTHFPDAAVDIVRHRGPTILFHLLANIRHVRTRRFPFLRMRDVQHARSLAKTVRERSTKPKTVSHLKRATPKTLARRGKYDVLVVGSDTLLTQKYNVRRPASRRRTNAFVDVVNTGIPTYGFALSADPLQSGVRFSPALNDLSRFRLITVRDVPTQHLMSQASIEAACIPDPTVLVDLHAALGTTHYERPHKDSERPVVGLHVPATWFAPLVEKVHNLGADHIDLRDHTHFGFDAFLSRVSTCHAIITDRFHTMLLGMLLANATPWFCETEKWSGETSKGRDLLSRLGFTSNTISYEQISTVELNLTQEDVANAITVFRQESAAALHRVLSSIESDIKQRRIPES